MCGTEPKMAQNFSYDLWLLDEGDDPNQATTLRAEEWVGLIDLSDAMGPSLLEASRTQRWDPNHLGTGLRRRRSRDRGGPAALSALAQDEGNGLVSAEPDL